jgi:amidohydrolase
MKNLIFWLLLAATGSLFAQNKPVIELSPTEYARIKELYKWLHQNPAPSNDEGNVARKMAAELTRLGFKIHPLSDSFAGFLALYENGSGPVIYSRVELDGLPFKSPEQTDIDFKSKTKIINGKDTTYILDGCSHGLHQAIAIATCELMIKNKSRWRGTYGIIVEHAEETGNGAPDMIKAGLFERFPKPQAILALHNSAEIAAGQVALVAEGQAMMPMVTNVDIEFKSMGCHIGEHYKCFDAILAAAHTLISIQTIKSEILNPILEPAIIGCGVFMGGTARNLYTTNVKMQLSVRCYSTAVRDKIVANIERIAKGEALKMNAPEPTIKVKNIVPALVNDSVLSRKVLQSFNTSLGKEQIVTYHPVMLAEPFAFYGKHVPICMFWLGAAKPDHCDEHHDTDHSCPGLHSPSYMPEWPLSIRTGTKACVNALIDLFGKE